MSMCLLKEAKINTDCKRSSNLHSTVFLWKDKQLKNCYFKAFIFHIIDNYISTYFSKIETRLIVKSTVFIQICKCMK